MSHRNFIDFFHWQEYCVFAFEQFCSFIHYKDLPLSHHNIYVVITNTWDLLVTRQYFVSVTILFLLTRDYCFPLERNSMLLYRDLCFQRFNSLCVYLKEGFIRCGKSLFFTLEVRRKLYRLNRIEKKLIFNTPWRDKI